LPVSTPFPYTTLFRSSVAPETIAARVSRRCSLVRSWTASGSGCARTPARYAASCRVRPDTSGTAYCRPDVVELQQPTQVAAAAIDRKSTRLKLQSLAY